MNNIKHTLLLLTALTLAVMASAGVYTMARANTKYRLSLNMYEWNKAFYALDETAEQFIADVDRQLAEVVRVRFSDNAETAASYRSLALEAVNGLTALYPGMEITEIPGQEDTVAVLNIQFISEENKDYCKLYVSLAVMDEANAASGQRYRVEAWQLC